MSVEFGLKVFFAVLESFEVENEDVGHLVNFEFLKSSHMIFAVLAIPSVFLFQLFLFLGVD